MSKVAYHLIHPDRRNTSVVFASPHSGRDYPAWFLQRSILDAQAVRSSEDAFVDLLFAAAPREGAPFLQAGAPRALIDLNRAADELDPALIEGVRKVGHNPRVSSGLGVVPRVVANGQAIYEGKLSRAEVDTRIESYWHPYHAALRSQMDQAHAMFGQAILIDCHSMPHEAMDQVARKGLRRPEVVLGDRFGASANAGIVEEIEQAFRAAGLCVARNTPFAGAYVTQHYGRPSRGRHAVQVEIDRALYMDEQRIEPNANFDAFRMVLNGVIAQIADIGRPADRALAAE
ncbi:N-formylglutamate amidohydrolase [Roseovarius pelagicus]|uniref:N-formylglutamate amidohydrolase n=1 Tax=Roseovarius pelagicus TaxID=2980108 RepID=A0ABY6D796_9RHOB|nr:N-formylglutamate amidohydrolase [Roseovarius pelagicus]UXX82021.1 N-formylglutamate amidohydrolase [Roseovarius pelagicus]